jgi:hypothetical protein
MICVEEGNDESSKDCRRSRVFAGCYIDRVFRGTAIGLKPNEYGISISRASNIWATLRSASHAHQHHVTRDFGKTEIQDLDTGMRHHDVRLIIVSFMHFGETPPETHLLRPTILPPEKSAFAALGGTIAFRRMAVRFLAE